MKLTQNRVMSRTNYIVYKRKKAKYLVQRAIKHSTTVTGEYCSMHGTLLVRTLVGLIAHL